MTTLAETSLSALERETLDRFVELLTDELGDDLVSVWLYGSRARGERPEPESDVDVLVLTRGDIARAGAAASKALEAAAKATGARHFFFSVTTFGLDWLADRRAVEADFIREVERDRVVLAGDQDGGDRPPLRAYVGMRPRTREYLDRADGKLEPARLVIGHPSSSISLAYYAMSYAARAALSERDLFARRHKGMWGLFHEHFVETGRFDRLSTRRPRRPRSRARMRTTRPRRSPTRRREPRSSWRSDSSLLSRSSSAISGRAALGRSTDRRTSRARP